MLAHCLQIPCRHAIDDAGRVTWVWPGGYAEFETLATQFTLELQGKEAQVRITIDVNSVEIFMDSCDVFMWNSPILANGKHLVRIQTFHSSHEIPLTICAIKGNAEIIAAPQRPTFIEFVGDSWTCGFGNLHPHNESADATLAWAALLAKSLHADYQLIAASGHGIAKNYGESFLERPGIPDKYDLVLPTIIGTILQPVKERIADLVLILAGENDFSEKPWPSKDLFFERAKLLISKINNRHANPKIIVCMVERMHPAAKLWEEFCLQQNIQSVEFSDLDANIPMGYLWHPSLEHHQKIAQELLPKIRENNKPR